MAECQVTRQADWRVTPGSNFVASRVRVGDVATTGLNNGPLPLTTGRIPMSFACVYRFWLTRRRWGTSMKYVTPSVQLTAARSANKGTGGVADWATESGVHGAVGQALRSGASAAGFGFTARRKETSLNSPA